MKKIIAIMTTLLLVGCAPSINTDCVNHENTSKSNYYGLDQQLAEDAPYDIEDIVHTEPMYELKYNFWGGSSVGGVSGMCGSWIVNSIELTIQGKQYVEHTFERWCTYVCEWGYDHSYTEMYLKGESPYTYSLKQTNAEGYKNE